VTPSTIVHPLKVLELPVFIKVSAGRLHGHAVTQVPLGAHHGSELLDVLLHGAVDDRVPVVAPAFHFLGGIAHPDLHLLVGLGTTTQETAAQLFKVGRQEENVGQGAKDERISTGSDVRGTVGVDVEEDINSVAEILEHGSLERAVVVPVHLGMLKKFPSVAVVNELVP